MAKVVFAIAAVLLMAMTAIASAQDSYRSRGYGGPLNVGPNFKAGGQYTPPSYGPKSSSREHNRRKKRAYQARKERKERAAKTVDTAKAAPVDKEVESENSSISSLAGDTDKSVPKKTETAKGMQNENSSISRAGDTDVEKDTAESSAVAKEDDESKRARNVGCKKYFPTAGVTLSVPCD